MNYYHSVFCSIISTVDTSLDSPQLKSVKAIPQLETIKKPLQSADMCVKTWPRGSKISRFMPVSSTERSVKSIPITNTTRPKIQCGQQRDSFRPQQPENLQLNSNICSRGGTTFESLSPKNLRHVEKSASIGQNVASYRKKRQSQDPTLVRIRLGLIKTGRIINSGAQFSNLEKIKGSSEESKLKNQSNGHPAGSEKPKIMLGEAKQKIRPTMIFQKAQNLPQASAERKRQLFKQTKNPKSSPKATINQKDIFQEPYNQSALKEYNELVSRNQSTRQNKSSEDCNTTNNSSNESNMMINTSQCSQSSVTHNQEPETEIRSQSATSETETSIITSHYNNASNQCSRMNCFHFPLKSPRSSNECGQLSRLCRPVIKRTSDSRPTYFKTPQAWRRSSSNQTGNASKSSHNRLNTSDTDSSKSSSSEATLREDCRFAKRYRGTRLYKKSATGCPAKFIGEKCDVAIHTESPTIHTNYKTLKGFRPEFLPQCLITLDQQQESKHTLHAKNCDRLGGINCPQLREQEGPPPLQPSVVPDMRSGADVKSCPDECVSTGEWKDKLLQLHWKGCI